MIRLKKKAVIVEDEKSAQVRWQRAADKVRSRIVLLIQGHAALLSNEQALIQNGMDEAAATQIGNQWKMVKGLMDPLTEFIDTVMRAPKQSWKQRGYAEKAAEFLRISTVELTGKAKACAITLKAVVEVLLSQEKFVAQLRLKAAELAAKIAADPKSKEQTQSFMTTTTLLFTFLLYWEEVCIALKELRRGVIDEWQKSPAYADLARLNIAALLDKHLDAEELEAETAITTATTEIARLAGDEAGTLGDLIFKKAEAIVRKNVTTGAGEVRMPILEQEAVVLNKAGAAKLRRRKKVEQMVCEHMKKLGILRDDE